MSIYWSISIIIILVNIMLLLWYDMMFYGSLPWKTTTLLFDWHTFLHTIIFFESLFMLLRAEKEHLKKTHDFFIRGGIPYVESAH